MCGGPILVVSDTHFGFEDESEERFLGFIKYLTRWVQDGTTTIKGTGEELDAPRKIILLGDFIDLWVSRDPNLTRPYKESFSVVSSLIALGREIVYVVGNHDGLMRFYNDQNVLCEYAHVHGERYPETPVNGKWQGVQMGDKKYLFLHGHQFSGFRNKSVLRLGNFVGAAAAAAEEFRGFRWLGGVACVFTAAVVVSAFFSNPFFSALSGLPTSFGAQFGAGSTLVCGLILGVLASLGFLWFCGALMSVDYALFTHPGGAPHNQYPVIQKLLDKIKRKLPRYPVSAIVRSRGFKQEAASIDADVVVFGHTHNPGVCAFENQQPNRRIKQLVNTGSWIEQQTDDGFDTFVYVDSSRGRLYKWHYHPGHDTDPGHVTELAHWSN
ncbi:MAG: metallophosphoesterase [Halobacteriota archaeon]